MALSFVLSLIAVKAQNPPTLQQISQSFQAAYDQKRYIEASALGLYGIALGERQPDWYYNTACSLSLAGDANRAFAALDEAIKAGFADAALAKNDSDLTALHADARWTGLVARLEKAEEKRRRELSDPDRAPFITADIPRFWAAYDKALQSPAGERAAIFQRDYFDRASDGMKDWMRVRKADAAQIAAFVDKNPRFFAAIRPATFQIAKQRPATLAAFGKFKSLYPAAQFPGVTFCVGAFYGGGTLSSRNLLMSAEMYTATPETPREELSRWQKLVLTPTDDLPFTIAHEMIHFQQRYPSSDQTLLRACLQEGSADFLGEMCSGSVGKFHQTEVFPYGDAHERELWERFQQDSDRTDKNPVWLYSESGEGKRPDDLGYYMGYKICESYYRHASDKKQAIHDILNIGDFKAFLKESRYAEKFDSTVSVIRPRPSVIPPLSSPVAIRSERPVDSGRRVR